MKAQIKTFLRTGTGYHYSDGVYAQFNAEGHDRYEPVDPENLESEIARLQKQFGEVHGLRLERLVTED